MIYPNFLKQGSCIGVPAPSSGAYNNLYNNRYNNAKKKLEEKGYKVVLSKNIFNSYYKDKSTRNKKGTGLGLTIVKVVVDLHNGECFVKNTSDGVKFIIKIKK